MNPRIRFRIEITKSINLSYSSIQGPRYGISNPEVYKCAGASALIRPRSQTFEILSDFEDHLDIDNLKSHSTRKITLLGNTDYCHSSCKYNVTAAIAALMLPAISSACEHNLKSFTLLGFYAPLLALCYCCAIRVFSLCVQPFSVRGNCVTAA